MLIIISELPAHSKTSSNRRRRRADRQLDRKPPQYLADLSARRFKTPHVRYWLIADSRPLLRDFRFSPESGPFYSRAICQVIDISGIRPIYHPYVIHSFGAT